MKKFPQCKREMKLGNPNHFYFIISNIKKVQEKKEKKYYRSFDK